MRAILATGAAALLVLAACAPPVPAPDRGTGAGFGDFASFELDRARREAALTGAPSGTFPVAVPSNPFDAPVPPGGIPSSDLAAAGIGVAPVATAPLGAAPPGAPQPGSVPAGPFISSGAPPLAPIAAPAPATAPAPGRAAGLEASPGNAAPALVGVAPGAVAPLAPPANEGTISDEQDFDAVASRESIESDAARRAEAAAQYAVVQPQELPQAPADTGPNIVEYALAAPNARGQEWYSRFAFSGEGRADRNCADYGSPDEAQRDFLARGGPDRDPRGIDPDGDGFACTWDPAPFRAAVGQ